MAVHGILVLLLGRPWFAMAAVSAFFLMLVLVNNAKTRLLREPFLFQDFEYFTDAIRHPRLYIPFFGWLKTLASATGFALAVLVGWWMESAPSDRFLWAGQLGAVMFEILMAMALLAAGSRVCIPVTFDPLRDVGELGLLSSLLCYGFAERSIPPLVSPFESLQPERSGAVLPHLVAVQSESFFDPRPLFAGIRSDVLLEFDRLRASAMAHGSLVVPAWGANTVRSEFAFISGLEEAALGVHRFNPYRKAASSGIETLATFLRRMGYRTICIHPYPVSFYARDRVYPLLGFDEFIDIDGFVDAQRAGPYTGDLAVAEKIASVLETASGPVFVFAITMENHGPLHLEKAVEEDLANLYDQAPPAGCDDLTVYLRHLRNTDHMIARLKATLESSPRSAGLCWFGDHVPIMPSVYGALGPPKGTTEYLIWRSEVDVKHSEVRTLNAHQLSVMWLREMGLLGY